MPSIGAPMSTVLIPALEASIGPIVDPHIESFFTIKSYRGTSHFSAKALRILVLTISVIYLWLALVLRTIP